MEINKVIIPANFKEEGIVIEGTRYEVKEIKSVLTFNQRLDRLILNLGAMNKVMVALVLTPTDFLVLHSRYCEKDYKPERKEATYMGNILIESTNASSSYIIDSEAKIWRI